MVVDVSQAARQWDRWLFSAGVMSICDQGVNPGDQAKRDGMIAGIASIVLQSPADQRQRLSEKMELLTRPYAHGGALRIAVIDHVAPDGTRFNAVITAWEAFLAGDELELIICAMERTTIDAKKKKPLH